MKQKKISLNILVYLFVFAFGAFSVYAAQPTVNMGTASNFSILAGSTVTNTGATIIAKDLGLHPGLAVTGFPPGNVDGTIHAGDATALQAKNDLTTAYNDASLRTPANSLSEELGGLTLIPGVYKTESSFLISSGDLTLDAQGDPDAVFIFQMGSTLTTISDTQVLLINNASPCNVFWQVGSSATIGTNSMFKGNILALSSITLTTGANLEGRALARNGAVTLDTNNVSLSCTNTVAPNSTSFCGDGIITFNEQCDAGINNGEVCRPYCERNCTYCNNQCDTVVVNGHGCSPPPPTPPPSGVPEFTPIALGLAVIVVGLGLAFIRKQ